MLKSVSKLFYKIRLNNSFREDLLWWATYDNKFNGQETILGKFAPLFSVYTDASDLGYAAMDSRCVRRRK